MRIMDNLISEVDKKILCAVKKTRFVTHWNNEDYVKFVEAIRLYGKDWKKVVEHVGTKT